MRQMPQARSVLDCAQIAGAHVYTWQHTTRIHRRRRYQHGSGLFATETTELVVLLDHRCDIALRLGKGERMGDVLDVDGGRVIGLLLLAPPRTF
jgi:hypothetical protein